MKLCAAPLTKKLSALIAIILCLALLASCAKTPVPSLSAAATPLPGQSYAEAGATATAANNGFDIYFVNVGKGDCTLIGLPGGKWALVDTGPESGAAAIHGLMTVLDVKQFEAIFISHPHNDHIGNLDHILSLAGSPVIYTGPATFERATDELNGIAAKRSVPIKMLNPGQSVTMAGVTFTALGPNGNFKDENDNSLVLMMEYGGVKALFPGDQQIEAEASLLKSVQDVRCTILKVAHHGQPDASSEAFLKAVSPHIAVIPTSGDADQGPDITVLDRLKTLNTATYVVGQTGTLHFLSADGSIAPFTPSGQAAGLVIESIDAKAEYVDIENPTGGDVHMNGWCLLSDKGNQTFFFPQDFVLKAGETIRIWSGVDEQEAMNGLHWSSKKIWSDKKEDKASLVDPYGRIVSTR